MSDITDSHTHPLRKVNSERESSVRRDNLNTYQSLVEDGLSPAESCMVQDGRESTYGTVRAESSKPERPPVLTVADENDRNAVNLLHVASSRHHGSAPRGDSEHVNGHRRVTAHAVLPRRSAECSQEPVKYAAGVYRPAGDEVHRQPGKNTLPPSPAFVGGHWSWVSTDKRTVYDLVPTRPSIHVSARRPPQAVTGGMPPTATVSSARSRDDRLHSPPAAVQHSRKSSLVPFIFQSRSHM